MISKDMEAPAKKKAKIESNAFASPKTVPPIPNNPMNLSPTPYLGSPFRRSTSPIVSLEEPTLLADIGM